MAWRQDRWLVAGTPGTDWAYRAVVPGYCLDFLSRPRRGALPARVGTLDHITAPAAFPEGTGVSSHIVLFPVNISVCGPLR